MLTKHGSGLSNHGLQLPLMLHELEVLAMVGHEQMCMLLASSPKAWIASSTN